jgi:hypothetical protein
VTALVAAAALSWDKPGAGWFATAAVGAMAVVVTTIGPGTTSGPLPDSAPRPARDREIRAFWAVLALALTAVGAVRAAGWLWLLCLPTACVCGALALVGGRSFAGLVKGALVFPVGVVRALPWGLRGVAASRGAGSSIVRTLAAVCVGLALLAVFATLLASADAAFATIIGDLLPTLDGATLVRWLGSGIVVGLGTLAACFLALRPPAYDKPSREPRWSLRRIEWAIPVGVLIVLLPRSSRCRRPCSSAAVLTCSTQLASPTPSTPADSGNCWR